MMTWIYTIKAGASTIITGDPFYAERKSKTGYIVFCKRKNNVYSQNNRQPGTPNPLSEQGTQTLFLNPIFFLKPCPVKPTLLKDSGNFTLSAAVKRS